MKTGQALIDDMNRLELEPGAVAFWWLGQLSYVVKAGGKLFWFDPWLAEFKFRTMPPLVKPEEVTNADFVFGSHNHGDHIDPKAIPGIAQSSPQARFVCSRVNQATVASLGVDESRIIALDEGLTWEEGNVRLTAIAAKHEFFDRDPAMGHPHLSFIAQNDGITIYHSGDTLCYEGMITKLSRWPLDLMFMPINGRDAARYRANIIGNMTYQEAVDMAGELRPRLAVPGHFMPGGNAAEPQLFADYIEAKFPDVAYWIGEPGEAVILPPRR